MSESNTTLETTEAASSSESVAETALTDVVQAGEDLFSAVTGDTVDTKVAGYINDGAMLATSALSLLGRTVSADANVVNTGLLSILKGVTAIVKGFKTKAAE